MSKLTGHAHYKQLSGETLKQYDLADEAVPVSVFELSPGGSWASRSEFESGDYVGAGVLAVANRRFLEENFGELLGTEWIKVYGGHGYANVFFKRDADERVPELAEMLEGLNDYASLDDELLSNIEMELGDEAWDNYGRDDFRRFLLAIHVSEEGAEEGQWEEVVDSLPDGVLDRMWFELLHNGNGEEVVFEVDPSAPHFDFDRAWSSSFGQEHPPQALLEKVLEERLPEAARELLKKERPAFAPIFGLDENERPILPDETIVRIAQGLEPDEFTESLSFLIEPIGALPSESTMRVLIDYLLENGGEWDSHAEHILHGKRFDRYA